MAARMAAHGRRGQRAVELVDGLLQLPFFELVRLQRGDGRAGFGRAAEYAWRDRLAVISGVVNAGGHGESPSPTP